MKTIHLTLACSALMGAALLLVAGCGRIEYAFKETAEFLTQRPAETPEI